MKKIILTLIITIGFIFSKECPETVNTWFKISTDVTSSSYGKVMQLDMSKGLAGTDGVYVYLAMIDKNTNEQVIISFPMGTWEDGAGKIEQEFKDLDDYLRKNKGKGIKIEYKYK